MANPAQGKNATPGNLITGFRGPKSIRSRQRGSVSTVCPGRIVTSVGAERDTGVEPGGRDSCVHFDPYNRFDFTVN